MSSFSSVQQTEQLLGRQNYIADSALSTVLYLALQMGKPLFVEGAPGVGKTELARAVASALQTELIRLQCYEGLDLSQAAYEWNYPRQLLQMQVQGAGSVASDDLYSTDYLLQRPLLRSIDPARDKAPVLLIDELDRADEEFESFLLELLSEFQMTIPELGTIRAKHRPIVILTSNRTREVHDALKRRCLYHWLDYPALDKEIEILTRKVPVLSRALAVQVARFSEQLRRRDLNKAPGVAESIDWATALLHLGVAGLDEDSIRATAGVLLKSQEDIERLQGPLLDDLLSNVSSDASSAAVDGRQEESLPEVQA